MNKPIKRHAAIVQFSREHHFGLLLSWKIRQAKAKSISAERVIAYILAFSKAELMPHFRREEKELFSLLDTTEQLRLQAENEHKNIAGQLEKIANEKLSVDELLNFAGDLDAHIRFEERVLFPYIEAHQNFETYADAMAKHNDGYHEDFDKNWDDKFWLS